MERIQSRVVWKSSRASGQTRSSLLTVLFRHCVSQLGANFRLPTYIHILVHTWLTRQGLGVDLSFLAMCIRGGCCTDVLKVGLANSL